MAAGTSEGGTVRGILITINRAWGSKPARGLFLHSPRHQAAAPVYTGVCVCARDAATRACLYNQTARGQFRVPSSVTTA